ncbi:MAG: hypothetical protein ACRDF0_02975, partial [Candidatus Limnocylindria bacterium]
MSDPPVDHRESGPARSPRRAPRRARRLAGRPDRGGARHVSVERRRPYGAAGGRRERSGTGGAPLERRAWTDLERYVIEEHIEDFQDGLIGRRELLRRVTLITGGLAITLAVLPTFGCDVSRPTGSAASSG